MLRAAALRPLNVTMLVIGTVAFATTQAVPAAEWRDEAGVPVLADAMATFLCAREAVHEGGDHRVFIGRVERLAFDPTQDPLIYFQGRYRSVHVPD